MARLAVAVAESSSLLRTIIRGSASSSASANGQRKPSVLLIGSGWGAFAAATPVMRSGLFNTTILSPSNHLVFTPLLASAAVGTLELRSIAEPIMHSFPGVSYAMGEATNISISDCEVQVNSSRGGGGGGALAHAPSLQYDLLILAVGARNNTFGIPGVEEHTLFLKDLSLAREIRRRIVRNVEAAASGGLTDAERKTLLAYVVVGGGPTGVEFAAELHDFVQQDLVRLYPTVAAEVSITIIEGKQLLGGFDASLRAALDKQFHRDGITMRTGVNVVRVERDLLHLSDGSSLNHGLCIWNTGLAPQRMTASLDPQVWKKDKWGHVVVDDTLRALSSRADEAKPRYLPGVFAIGDCAAVVGRDYAATAQVAEQQGTWLGEQLVRAAKSVEHLRPAAASSSSVSPAWDDYVSSLRAACSPENGFTYRHRGALAYIGGFSAAADFSKAEGARGTAIAPLYGHTLSGFTAFALYRSVYLTKLGSLRNKLLVPIDWMKTIIFGRDTTTF